MLISTQFLICTVILTCTYGVFYPHQRLHSAAVPINDSYITEVTCLDVTISLGSFLVAESQYRLKHSAAADYVSHNLPLKSNTGSRVHLS